MKRLPPLTTQRARDLRRNATHAERILWHYLRKRSLAGCRFRRQHPVAGFIVDFVCLEARLIVEIDGSQHKRQEPYDAHRTKALNEAGFRVLRFWNNEVMGQTAAVLEVIWRALEGVRRPSLQQGSLHDPTPSPAPPPSRGRGKR